MENENKIRLGRYRHFKGNYYRVLCLATHTETLEEVVVYRAEYGEHGIWARPLKMWNETVQFEGKAVKRFTFVEDTEK